MEAFMEVLPKLILLTIGLAFVLTATTADAANVRKHRRQAQAATVVDNSRYRGTNLFFAGPVYNGPDYIGDDPDPFIRLMLKRDLSGRYGGAM
jgi:hypothetical protein